MARALLAGSKLNEIAGSLSRYPGVQILVWNPNRVTINQVAAGDPIDAPLDLSPFLELVRVSENIGHENGGDPSVPRAEFVFRKNPIHGTFVRGWIEDKVVVQIRWGDRRVKKEDWIPIFTGLFRGRPGLNPGTRADGSEGFIAQACGREQQFVEAPPITTQEFPVNTDLGVMAAVIAHNHMKLGPNEILFGAQGVETKHLTNQIVETNPLEALWQCLFPMGKKPKFDSQGRLVAVDVNLAKPAARIYTTGGDKLIESIIASPNEVEVNTQVVLHGLSSILTKVRQEEQVLSPVEIVTGFFDSDYSRKLWFSKDKSLRADDTRVVSRRRIRWSDASWSQIDEFHGRLSIDTRYLRDVQVILFITYLASQILIAIIDLFFQAGEGLTLLTAVVGINATVAAIRFALQIITQVSLVGLLWAMNYLGRGEYDIVGKPFENVYQELITDARVKGLRVDQIRKAEFRNDFISTMADLDARAAELLRRELVKNQLYQITLLYDPLLEVDDVIQTADGSRYYILSVDAEFSRGAKPVMNLTCWKVYEDFRTAVKETLGYGDIYAEIYGEAF